MNKPLNDAKIFPTDAILTSILGSSSDVYKAFTDALTALKIDLEWRYYNDGKSWLGKATSHKKTIFWLSIWQGYFKLSFYFNEKARLGIANLPIADELKTRIANEPLKGKLVALIIDVSESADFKDVFTLISYKQSFK